MLLIVKKRNQIKPIKVVVNLLFWQNLMNFKLLLNAEQLDLNSPWSLNITCEPTV